MLHEIFVNSVYDIAIDSFSVNKADKSRRLGGWAVDKLRYLSVPFTAKAGQDDFQVSRTLSVPATLYLGVPDSQKAGFSLTVPAGITTCELVLDLPGGKKTVSLALDEVEKTFRFQKARRYAHLGRTAAGLLLTRQGRDRLALAVRRRLPAVNPEVNAYHDWIAKNEQYDRVQVDQELAAFAHQPLISLVVPVYNVGEEWLRKCIDSVLGQWYQNFQLCLADDKSPSPHVRRVLDEYAAADPRITVVYREENGGISAATNSALAAAKGEYIGFLDNDDELAPFALFEMVKRINQVPQADFLYSDEDKVNAGGTRFDPFFKPGFSPHLLLSHNYITHFVVVSADLCRRAGGGLRSEFNGSQDYDFVLRATEAAHRVEHIAAMLYHWRTLPSSVAGDPRSKMYAYEAGQHAIEEALSRRGLSGFTVTMLENLGTYQVSFDLAAAGQAPSVGLVYSDYSPAALSLLRQRTSYPAVQFLSWQDFDSQRPWPQGRPDYLVFLQGLVPLHQNWLDQLLSPLGDPSVGLVGGKVLAPNAKNLNVGISLSGLRKHQPFTARGSWDLGIGYYFRTVVLRDVFALSEECLALSTTDFERLGGFESSLSEGLQGVDLSIRLRDQLNRAAVFSPFAIFSDWKHTPAHIDSQAIDDYLERHPDLHDSQAVRLFPPDFTSATTADTSSPIAYSIDRADFDKQTGRLHVYGWAADRQALSATRIELVSQSDQAAANGSPAEPAAGKDPKGLAAQAGPTGPGLVSQADISTFTRPDANSHLFISVEQHLGFDLAATVTAPDDLLLVFTGTAHAQIINLGTVIAQQQAGRKSQLVGRVRQLADQLAHPRSLAGRVVGHYQRELQSRRTYSDLIKRTEAYDRAAVAQAVKSFDYQPLISILMPVYNVEEKWLRKCVESVQAQWYDNWELCIADDCSPDEHVREVLRSLAEADVRIKVVYRPENGHISQATNSALDLAQGEFVALMDDDDELPPFALYEVVSRLNAERAQGRELDLIYSDEDKITEGGRRWDPAFKPDFSPDLLLSTNYISHLGVYRTSIAKAIGGFRVGFEGSQDYDFVLRFLEQSEPAKVAHIAKVLYHWRTLPSSTASGGEAKDYASEAGLCALQEALDRRGIEGLAKESLRGIYQIDYAITSANRALVSVIIPTRDGYDNVDRVLASIAERTDYPNFEILIADNGSRNPRMADLYENYRQCFADTGIDLRVLHLDIPFNYSRINNLAAKEAKGRYLLFLNDDTQVISPEWMRTMVGLAQFERVGMVGAKLAYPTGTIQHAGIVLGMGGVAGHIMAGWPACSRDHFGRLYENVNYYAVTAACCMVKVEDFWAVGGFDESFDVAYNDVDLCIRIHDQLGKDNVYAAQAQLYHFESQTRGLDTEDSAKTARLKAESERFYAKYQAIVDNDPYYNPNLSRTSGNFWIRED